jgi:hypothetical protein
MSLVLQLAVLVVLAHEVNCFLAVGKELTGEAVDTYVEGEQFFDALQQSCILGLGKRAQLENDKSEKENSEGREKRGRRGMGREKRG